MRTLLAIGAITLVPAFIAGCGGDDDVDPQTVIEETFNNDEQVTSGDLSLSLEGSAEGDQSGSFEASLNGPFQADPENPASIPQLDWTGSISGEGAGQSAALEGGVTITADNAFVEYGGEAYEIGTKAFGQFKRLADRAAKQNTDESEGLSFSEAFKQSCEQSLEQQGASDTSACDVDFESWLTDLNYDGTEDIEGTETDHVSGSIDVETMIADLVELGSAVPETESEVPSEEEISQVADAVDEASFDLYSGTDDRILRGLDFTISIDPSAIPDAQDAGVESIEGTLTVRLGAVNEEQTIEPPANPKPIDQLLQQFGVDPDSLGDLGDLGDLGGLGGAGLGGGADAGNGGGGAAAPGSGDTDAYLECISQAKSPDEITECESEL